MFIELWDVCAGNLANIPKEKQRVFYFPQGHMEQLQGTIMDDEQSKHVPAVNLPSKVPCRVVNVMRTAEPDTDEVYAQITLQAEIEIDKTNEEHEQPESPKPVVRTFSKILTASDTSTHGGLSVNGKHATECLLPLDMSQTTPNQELVAKELYEWLFRHIYRGEPRRHLFTTGWSSFVSAKKLIAGDEFVFLRGGNDDIRVGVRRFSSHSVLSSHNMNLIVLATTAHAIAGKSLFVIYYKPRASPFIIGVDQYMEAVSRGYDVGMCVKMSIEAQDSTERRCNGMNQHECLDCLIGFHHGMFSLTASKGDESQMFRLLVKMQGVAVGRSIDLTALRGYNDLIIELERMFEIKGEIYTSGKWDIVFTDKEGDTMLVGYDPWPEFCKMVKKIVIYSKDEVKNMKPILSSEGDGTLYSGNNRSDA
ncbi:Auxin response factor 18 [Linum perenne]